MYNLLLAWVLIVAGVKIVYVFISQLGLGLASGLSNLWHATYASMRVSGRIPHPSGELFSNYFGFHLNIKSMNYTGLNSINMYIYSITVGS